MAGGRKIAFDKQQALESAMKVFWEKGYTGASLSDLTNGMGINKPSMYSTFGNKEALFIKAMDHYVEHYAQPLMAQLNLYDLTPELRLKNYMLATLESQCLESTPKGCYVVQGVTESASGCIPLQALKEIELVSHSALDELEKFFSESDCMSFFNTTTTPSQKALYINTVLHGTASLARAGKNKKDLETVVGQAIDSVK